MISSLLHLVGLRPRVYYTLTNFRGGGGQGPLGPSSIRQCDVITSKTNSKLSFLRRNLKGCPEKLRETAYFSLVRSFLEYSATVWHPRQKYNSDKLEVVQRRAARFVKGKYGMFESVTQMLEQLTWITLSKRRKNSRLILFYKIINNLAVVPQSCLEKADVRTRKKTFSKVPPHRLQLDPYGQSFFPNCFSAWNGLAKAAKDIAEANTLDILSLSFKIRLRQRISKHIRQRILLINEPEPFWDANLHISHPPIWRKK